MQSEIHVKDQSTERIEAGHWMSVEPPKKIQTQNHNEAVSDAEQLAGRALFTSREWAGEWSGSTGDLTPARPCARWSRPTMKQTWAEKSRTTIVEGSNKKEKNESWPDNPTGG
jgi:hypothetical protein